MSIKEKPLIDAASDVDPLPSFLYANPVFAGFITIFMCAVFGAVFVGFVSSRGGPTALELFEISRIGAIVSTLFGATVLVFIGVRAILQREEVTPRMLMVFGGLLCVALLYIIDRLAVDDFRTWLEAVGPIAGSDATWRP